MSDEAGREMDARVAVEVFSLIVKPIQVLGHGGFRDDVGVVSEPYKMADGREGISAGALPRYSTDIAAAWEVVRVVRDWPFSRRLAFTDALQAAVSGRLDSRWMLHPRAIMLYVEPEDICRASLAALALQPDSEPNPAVPGPTEGETCRHSVK